jgi:hypothetical protein
MKLAVLISILAPLCIAQEQASKTPVRIGDIVLARAAYIDHGSTREMLRAVLYSANVSGGIVLTSGCQPAPDIYFQGWSGQPLTQLLDGMVALDQAHTWSFRQGVVDLLPRTNTPAVFNLSIKHFEWITSEFTNAIVGRLFQEESIRRHLAGRGLVPGIETGPGLYRAPRIVDGHPEQGPPGEAKSVDGLDVLSVLNAIAASHESAVWWYEERVCGTEHTYTINGKEP